MGDGQPFPSLFPVREPMGKIFKDFLARMPAWWWNALGLSLGLSLGLLMAVIQQS
jgi:hypothetical protein